MAQIAPIIFIGILYGIWKWLDSMQLPNTISILLVGLVVVCGGFWFYNKFNPSKKNGFTDFFGSLFGVLALVTILRSFVFEPFQIPSGSMENGHPERGDIIVFKAPKQPHVDYIKRVIGIGGDTVKYDMATQSLTVTSKDGTVNVFKYENAKPNADFFYHGEMQVEKTEIGSVTHQILNNPSPFNYAPYFFKQEGQIDGEWVVPDGHYFVMGDNRDNSEDSRFWGFVPEQNIVGKATFLWLSLDKKPNEFPKGLRFERMFTSIQ